MADFTRFIRVDGKNLEFRFSLIEHPESPSYFVGVMAHNHKSYAFNMKKTAEGWRIVTAPLPPDWIMAVEDELSEAIERK